MEPGFVEIVNPDTLGVAEVHEDGLWQWYPAGWVLLTDDNGPPAQAAPGEPAPMTRAEVAEKQAAREQDPGEGAAKTGGRRRSAAHHGGAGESKE